MVSTDGPKVTPDGPEPDDVHASETKPVSRIADPSRGKTGSPGNGHTETAQNGSESETPADDSPAAEQVPADNKKKPRKRRARKIDRLVMEFQPDAVEMEHRKVAGGLRWTLYVVILLLISTVAWATWAKVDRLVVAQGKLISPEEGTIVIQPPTTGPIRSFNAKFGQTVRSGDIIATLDPTIPAAEVSKLEAQTNGLKAQMTRLEAEQSGAEFSVAGHTDDPVWLTEQLVFIDRKDEEAAMKEQFAAEKRKLEATRSKHEADVSELTSRLAKQEEMLATTARLERNNTATRRELLDEQIQVGFIKNQLINAENSIRETDADLESLAKRESAQMSVRKAEVSTKLAESRQTNASIVEELNKARRASEMVTIAVPEHELYNTFVVVEVAESNVGSTVQPGDSLVRLIPADAPLEVECKVQTQDIARIREMENGDPRSVRIKLNAFPYMKHGTLEGQIRAISEDVFEEGQAPATRAFYRVRVEITSYELDEVPTNHRLRPGMEVTAEIKVGRRRVIDYFLYPLFRSLDSSIREP